MLQVAQDGPLLEEGNFGAQEDRSGGGGQAGEHPPMTARLVSTVSNGGSGVARE